MKIEEAFQSVNRLFLDSAPVIYYVDMNPGYSAIMDGIFDLIRAAQIRVVTSPVTLAECLILPLRDSNLSQQQLFIDIITGQDTADFVNITSEIARTAADIRARYRLQLPDAFQIATALNAGCQAFLTNDAQLKRIAELKILLVSELEA
ncbi:PIN domain-containing protein [Limnospira fusiformis KN01]|uniref:PilT protein domain protein n=1 Tax=Limnospira maxima CS-328 TaxID=513049 RepID=B5W7D2_LIMMA|nr:MULTISPECIES: PIN domain-containing protein [Limnospira]EDZ92553.1 PilT protein domain protein [Limnospira maxima CS-328]MDC0840018.1 PIN domain-containing protein [Limnoraphis robusta]MDT9197792.1 PIN domain-containing protein [Limnospira sp. PMC 1042.18]ULB47904.1 PIN domain-containing protein [Limnospira fusiformis KN01]